MSRLPPRLPLQSPWCGTEKGMRGMPGLRRDGPLGRPAGKASAFRSFPAHSDYLPAVRPVAAPYEAQGPRLPTASHREVYSLGRRRVRGALPDWRRDGPLGRPAEKASAFRSFPAHSDYLPAVRPVAAPYEARGHGSLRHHIGGGKIYIDGNTVVDADETVTKIEIPENNGEHEVIAIGHLGQSESAGSGPWQWTL